MVVQAPAVTKRLHPSRVIAGISQVSPASGRIGGWWSVASSWWGLASYRCTAAPLVPGFTRIVRGALGVLAPDWAFSRRRHLLRSSRPSSSYTECLRHHRA
uniref:Uncharacterized protein n=1 Tax=Arundo donax TaxID=35708 RepID=A0A0A9EH53_ARUDO